MVPTASCPCSSHPIPMPKNGHFTVQVWRACRGPPFKFLPCRASWAGCLLLKGSTTRRSEIVGRAAQLQSTCYLVGSRRARAGWGGGGDQKTPRPSSNPLSEQRTVPRVMRRDI